MATLFDLARPLSVINTQRVAILNEVKDLLQAD
jgi:hypothetical protein